MMRYIILFALIAFNSAKPICVSEKIAFCAMSAPWQISVVVIIVVLAFCCLGGFCLAGCDD